MFSKRDMERRDSILDTARNPRVSDAERIALDEWMAGVPVKERSQAVRSEAELDLVRQAESADARKDARAMTADKGGRPSLVAQCTLELQVVTAPSRSIPLAKNDKSIEDAPTVRAYHKHTATANRATATTSFTADRELSVAVKRAAAQADVDAEHRRAARLDYDEVVLTPHWDGSCGWNRDSDSTPLTRKRAPSAFTGPEQWAIRNARSQRIVYVNTYDSNGVLLSTCCKDTVGAGALLTIEETVCAKGYPCVDILAAAYIGTHARAAAQLEQRITRAAELQQINDRCRAQQRATGRLLRKRGRKHR